MKMYGDQDKHDDVYGQLMNDVVASVQSETISEEAEHIRSAIHFYIKKWLDEVEEINPLFKVKELIGVGSYAEGTKILEPNEFDYLAVIDEFSKPGLLNIDRDESNFYEGLVKVKVKDDDLKSRCSDLCKSGHLQCFQPINFPGLGEHRFGHVFIEGFRKYAKKNELRWGPGTGSPTHWTGTINLPAVNKISLLLEGADYTVPYVLIYFKYKGRQLTTDLSPAIRYFKPEDCFNVKDCAGPVFAELVLSRESLLLIGTQQESDFKITVTEAEVEYMKSVMKPEHKTIYIFLKYVTKLYTDKAYAFFNPFTSYMLKTVCVHHDVYCIADKISMRHCLESVIDDLMTCAQQGYVISIVDKHIHIDSGRKHPQIQDYRTSMLTDMKNMCKLPQGIKTVDAFIELIEYYVLNEKQKRDKERNDRRQRYKESEERFYENIQREVSKFTNMGFEKNKAESAMERALDDPELALLILEYEAERRKEKKKQIEPDITPPKQCSPTQAQAYVPSVYCQTATDTSVNLTEESICDTDIQQIYSTPIMEEVIYERQKP
ncbi:uncharacterized protein LOC132759562 isoform X2 [Ruditapes philippinarum]|uniref:uncharacterized protein LOC132759562 isoform X2 n=1 Tax=Ruditapes philippinarum TaxID=129788 RepID=UPI00295A8B46|nr:uncharacterized protein LOC132759562 isoform X2 [Ruditapes philippinarum]